jgi:hypothetical protein
MRGMSDSDPGIYRVSIEYGRGGHTETHACVQPVHKALDDEDAMAFALSRCLRGLCDETGAVNLDNVIAKLITYSKYSMGDDDSPMPHLVRIAEAWDEWDGTGIFQDFLASYAATPVPANNGARPNPA